MSSIRPQDRPSVLSAVYHRGRAVLARLLRGAKTCRVIRRAGSDGPVYVRWRPWHAGLLIPAGNAFMALMGEQVRFLPRRQWLDWEARVYAALGGIQVDTEVQGRLLVPGFEGMVLADFLCSGSYGREQRMAAFQAAVESLRQAHETPILWPDGTVRLFSHADATARNVIYNPQTGRAAWIDFETLHAPTQPAECRHADDLRALTWSAAECLGPEYFDGLCRAVVVSYGGRGVLDSLDQLLARQVRPNLYQLAQGLLPLEQHTTLVVGLREHLRNRNESKLTQA